MRPGSFHGNQATAVPGELLLWGPWRGRAPARTDSEQPEFSWLLATESHVWVVFKFLPLLKRPRAGLGRSSPGFSQEGPGLKTPVWLVAVCGLLWPHSGRLQLLERQWGKPAGVACKTSPGATVETKRGAKGSQTSTWGAPHGATSAVQNFLKPWSPGTAPSSGQCEPASVFLGRGPRPSGRGLGKERGPQGPVLGVGPSLNRRSTPRPSPNPPST